MTMRWRRCSLPHGATGSAWTTNGLGEKEPQKQLVGFSISCNSAFLPQAFRISAVPLCGGVCCLAMDDDTANIDSSPTLHFEHAPR
ncbi:uncharacterized protein QC761_0017190 [Podospora bellae-mahoneyi]|uniref:Uncharacterized protein n=1 Tax=Podospora bellae-mahoneyi TaxID=2093777 RepID=A0ABR0FZX4_9PEZI|nr:hypothetical protein QC761_0017190 [Podospora bellae-mahoneyi]